MATLSNRIRSLRQERGLTQDELGRLFGIVKSTVSQIGRASCRERV